MKDIKYLYCAVFFLLMQIFVIIRNLLGGYNNFFWFCDFVPILFALGFFFQNINFIKSLINIGLIPQILVMFDFAYQLTSGKSLFHTTEELFTLGLFFILAAFFIHLSAILAFLFTYKEKTNKSAISYSFFSLILIYAVTLLFTSPLGQINLVYASGEWSRYLANYVSLYIPLWILMAFIIFVIPTQIIQHLVYKKSRKLSSSSR
jgi:hypothetical protein